MEPFILDPYVGAIPLTFGLTRQEVHALLGSFSWSDIKRSGNILEEYTGVNVIYRASDRTLAELAFNPATNVLLGDVNLSLADDLDACLRQFDPKPYTFLSSLIFLELGVVVSSDLPAPENRVIRVFCRGWYDDMRTRFVQAWE